MLITIIYILAAITIIASVCLSIYARQQINSCTNEEQKKAVKAKWQLICGLFGGASIMLITLPFIISMIL